MAAPITFPSTLTSTLLSGVPMPWALSIAQPASVTVPETVAFGVGVSMLTVGGPSAPVTVMLTLAEPVSGKRSLSVAEIVMVWEPLVRVAVFSWYVKPTLGQPGRPG